MDGIGGGVDAGSRNDAVMMIPTPDNSMTEDAYESRRKPSSTDPEASQSNNPPNNTPISLESTQVSLHHSPKLTQYNALPHLPSSISSSAPSVPASAPSWSQTRSPVSQPSNPFYSSTYRSSTPPIPSSSEQSPVVSPAKRFSSGELKPLFTPNSPRQPLNEEDRIKFTQVPFSLIAINICS